MVSLSNHQSKARAEGLPRPSGWGVEGLTNSVSIIILREVNPAARVKTRGVTGCGVKRIGYKEIP